jgi:hypothetical protein
MPDMNTWAAKFHTGPYLYTGDIDRGFDVFRWSGQGPAPWDPEPARGAPLSAELDGEQEVDPVLGQPGAGDPLATGFAEARFQPGAGEVCYELSHDLVPEPFGFHIHEAPVGENGPIVVDFFTDPTGVVPPAGCVEVEREVATDILSNPEGYYFNVHNATFPNGAIRGQLDTSSR